ncbi:hypothetical protein [Dolichospermum phage Dfl-JY45]
MNSPINMEDPFARHPLGGQGGRTVRSVVRGVITADPRDDAPPAKTVLLDHVTLDPSVLTRPVHGVSFFFGKSDLHILLEAAFHAAQAQERVAYEVEVAVDITAIKQVGGLRADDLIAESLRAPANRQHYVIYLNRMSESGSEYLEQLFADEIAELRDPDTGELDEEVREWRFPKIIARYPHLLDVMAAHPAFAHVIMFVWECAAPAPAGGVVEGAKIATLYHPGRVLEVETIGADFIRAVLPVIGDSIEVQQALEAKGIHVAAAGM